MISVMKLRSSIPSMPDSAIKWIRYDARAGLIYIIDVFRAMTGCTPVQAGQDLYRILRDSPNHHIYSTVGGCDSEACSLATMADLIKAHRDAGIDPFRDSLPRVLHECARDMILTDKKVRFFLYHVCRRVLIWLFVM